ncbi:MAG: Na+/H+ antiporter subunit E [Atribacterota bacterium]|nr:Na+/H+ antiporter subunit E [Atribacterota bacterium]MDD4895276.1 Na+/H+ antiporter subunit E [Atribacterota bacterium]MDD5636600.1 Na+/H+ antiporter subunit E [Atribacterota bacterium]
MISFIITFILSFFAYLFLTASQGEVLGLWSQNEIIAALIVGLIVTIISARVLFQKKRYHLLNPLKWVIFLFYLVGPFFYAMAKANIDVAYRVITGKINPGIVKISPKLKSDAAITLLANSITLTPGTLSVDIDEKNNDLYIHWINVTNLKPSIEDICGTFSEWARRIAE